MEALLAGGLAYVATFLLPKLPELVEGILNAWFKDPDRLNRKAVEREMVIAKEKERREAETEREKDRKVREMDRAIADGDVRGVELRMRSLRDRIARDGRDVQDRRNRQDGGR